MVRRGKMKEDFKITRRKFIGLTALALAYGCTHVNTANLLQSTKVENLEALVTSKASNYQVVMFGEQHGNYRRDDDFVIRLLPEMKNQGFRYLALEIERNPIRGHKLLADYASGKLSREDITPEKIAKLEWVNVINDTTKEIITIRPESLAELEGWFDIIDAAKREDIKVLCYDANTKEVKSSDEREKKAFENLKELVFCENPSAKLMIYCGAVHLNKAPVYSPTAHLWEMFNNLQCNKGKDKMSKFLAYYLNEYTHGSLLTVSLVGETTRDEPDLKDFDLTIDLKKGVVKHLR